MTVISDIGSCPTAKRERRREKKIIQRPPPSPCNLDRVYALRVLYREIYDETGQQRSREKGIKFHEMESSGQKNDNQVLQASGTTAARTPRLIEA